MSLMLERECRDIEIIDHLFMSMCVRSSMASARYVCMMIQTS
jgi:hypothetical protein